MPKFNR